MPTTSRTSSVRLLRIVLVTLVATILWAVSAPEGITDRGWHLLIIFGGAIAAVVLDAMPIFVAAILSMSIAILTRTLSSKEAFSGFSEDFLLLIISAFLLARVMIASGLGVRIAYHIIRKLGHSTLGLSYSIFITDALIAPFFPSNTARSGVLYPIVRSICLGSGSDPEQKTEKRLGHYLMMSAMVSLAISSALWLTAMVANPIGAKMLEPYGVKITFASWFLNSSVPSLCAMAILPYLLMRWMNPIVRRTPEAARLANEALAQLGPMRRKEWITLSVFLFLILAWAAPSSWGLNRAAVAFFGIAILMLAGIFDVSELKKEGETLEIFIWFAALYALSSYLNELGIIKWLGSHIASSLKDAPVLLIYASLVSAYILIHYLFVSQTAHLLALAPMFFGVATQAGVPAALIGYMILFATNFFSTITPQGSSANVLFTGSGYLQVREVYRYGGLATAALAFIYLSVGSIWIWILT